MNEFQKPYTYQNVKCGSTAFEVNFDVWVNPETKTENVNIKDYPNCQDIVKIKTSQTTISAKLPNSSSQCGVERKVEYNSRTI